VHAIPRSCELKNTPISIVEYTSASAANETAIAGLLSRGSSAAFSATPRRTRAFPIINLATGAIAGSRLFDLNP
jgi:hypothetical protein